MNHTSSQPAGGYAVVGEIREKHEKNKMTLKRNFLISRSQSPDWECIVVETLFCVPKVGFGNEIKGVNLRNEMKCVGLGNKKKMIHQHEVTQL